MSWFGFGEEKKTGVKEGCTEKIIFDAPMSSVLAVIYDYNNYGKFLTDINEVKVSKVYNDQVTDVYWKISLLLVSIDYTLKLTKTKNGLTWESTEHGPFEYNRGGWVLEEKDGKIHAEYTVDCAFNVWVPGFMRDYVVGMRLPATLEAFKKRIEEHHASTKK